MIPQEIRGRFAKSREGRIVAAASKACSRMSVHQAHSDTTELEKAGRNNRGRGGANPSPGRAPPLSVGTQGVGGVRPKGAKQPQQKATS